MPKKISPAAAPDARYWLRRVRSKPFKQALAALLRQEAKVLADERIGDVVDGALVRRLIEEWDVATIDRRAIADLVIQVNRALAGRGRKAKGSLLGLLDPDLVARLDAVFDEDAEVARHVEEFVARLMGQEFVRRLFTDIVFTSIVSFYEKVNPLFGALTTRVLEEQIKSFIRRFMPALERQATAFALNPANQRFVLELARSTLRQVLDEPLAHYAAMVSKGQRQKAEALLRAAFEDAKLAALLRDVALAGWEQLYRAMRARTVGELLHLEAHAEWLAARGVELLVPLLARPGLLAFVAAEMALAQPAPAAPK